MTLDVGFITLDVIGRPDMLSSVTIMAGTCMSPEMTMSRLVFAFSSRLPAGIFGLQTDEQAKTAEEKRATCVALVTLVTLAPSNPWRSLAFTRKDR